MADSTDLEPLLNGNHDDATYVPKLPSNIANMNHEQDSFAMGVFYNTTCPSKWIYFLTFTNTYGYKTPSCPPGIQPYMSKIDTFPENLIPPAVQAKTKIQASR